MPKLRRRCNKGSVRHIPHTHEYRVHDGAELTRRSDTHFLAHTFARELTVGEWLIL